MGVLYLLKSRKNGWLDSSLIYNGRIVCSFEEYSRNFFEFIKMKFENRSLPHLPSSDWPTAVNAHSKFCKVSSHFQVHSFTLLEWPNRADRSTFSSVWLTLVNSFVHSFNGNKRLQIWITNQYQTNRKLDQSFGHSNHVHASTKPIDLKLAHFLCRAFVFVLFPFFATRGKSNFESHFPFHSWTLKCMLIILGNHKWTKGNGLHIIWTSKHWLDEIMQIIAHRVTDVVLVFTSLQNDVATYLWTWLLNIVLSLQNWENSIEVAKSKQARTHRNSCSSKWNPVVHASKVFVIRKLQVSTFWLQSKL